MTQIAIAASLFRLDFRWRFCLFIFAGVAGMLALMYKILLYTIVPVGDPALFKIFAAIVLCVPAIAGVQQIGPVYQLALPVSTRCLFLATLFIAACSLWIPALAVTSLFVLTQQAHEFRMPLACAALWTAGFSLIWVGWAKRRTAPRFAIILLFLIEVGVAARWLLVPPSTAFIAALLVLSACALVFTALRLPASFEMEVATRDSGLPSSRPFPFTANSWLMLARLILPLRGYFAVWLCLAFVQRNNVPLQAFWCALLYLQISPKDALLLTLPVSRVRVVYARLLCAYLFVWLGSHYGPPAWGISAGAPGSEGVRILLTLTLTLVLVAACKLVTWHRLRRWPRWVNVGLLFGLFAASAASIGLGFTPTFTNRVLESINGGIIAIPAIACALLLWLIAIETRESDHLLPPSAAPQSAFGGAS